DYTAGSQAGFNYLLTYSDTLGNTNPWTISGTSIAGTDGSLGPFIDNNATNPIRFYRIELEP
ncbi:MAG: hypothetical protein ACO363_09610, partial [Balneolaceae bacterium]